MEKVSVVLPTFNEKENIAKLITSIERHVGSVEVIVVDDDSPDGTWKVVEEIENKNQNVRLLRRVNKRGLASAISDGITLSTGDKIIWMDCDFSHPPELIPKLIEALSGNDIAIASRYVEGGRDVRSFDRVLTSWLLNLYVSTILGFSIRDYTTGFLAVKRKVFDKVTVVNKGHGEYCIDFLYRCKKNNFKIKEVPYKFSERKKGETKTSQNVFHLLKHGCTYGFTVLKLRFGSN